METNTNIPFKFTAGAEKEIHRLLTEQPLADDMLLRIGVEGGGCAGMSYVLGFDNKKDGDDIFDVNGIKVLLNKAHTLYLAGMEIDWQDGLNNRGFIFNNPNASKTCGCGTSFSV